MGSEGRMKNRSQESEDRRRETEVRSQKSGDRRKNERSTFPLNRDKLTRDVGCS
jgi:hypothetical protein